MELKETTAIITGSTGQLGAAIAKALAKAGCNCICHYNTNEKSAQQLAEQIQTLDQTAIAIQADLKEPEQIKKLFNETAKIGIPQILINSAAVFPKQPLEDITFQTSQELLNLNLIAPVLTSQIFAEKLKAKFDESDAVVGKIINISDIGGIKPWAKYAMYCASKAGLIGATKALAKELAPMITVNSVAPGLVTWPENFNESQKKRQLSFIPAGRIAELSEITSAIIFLLRNDYVTGQIINVDGGRCI